METQPLTLETREAILAAVHALYAAIDTERAAWKAIEAVKDATLPPGIGPAWTSARKAAEAADAALWHACGDDRNLYYAARALVDGQIGFEATYRRAQVSLPDAYAAEQGELPGLDTPPGNKE